MQVVQVPELPKLRGEEAIKVLRNFVGELEEQRTGELTGEQTTALIKLSLGLISSIEAENQSTQFAKGFKEQLKEETRFISRLKKRFQRPRVEG
jgi:hypothetical protein